MKTININLIDNLGKTPAKRKGTKTEEVLDSKVKMTAIILIVGAFTLFISSFGSWLVISNLSKKADIELKQVKMDVEKLTKEKDELSSKQKDIKDEKMISELKILAKNQIENAELPWSLILEEITNKVPKNLTITQISKLQGSGNLTDVRLVIKGAVSEGGVKLAKASADPLKMVSYFILNINEDKSPNAFLSDAKIRTVETEKDSDIYEFEIETAFDLLKMQNLNKPSDKTNINEINNG